ncbi:MAG TPA: hypothetical protein VF844_15705 [Ktedonobacteraceae bacterium]
MSRFLNRKGILSVLVALTLVIAFAGGIFLRGSAAHAASGTTTKSEFCNKLGKTIQASSGAQNFCFGAQPNGSGTVNHSLVHSFGPNVDAANPSEDVSPTGVQSYGQSETSVAASGHYAVEAWNDATGFFSSCGAPENKEELTGLGFSADNGASYTDLGGLPNAGCNNNLFEGDPSVEAWTTGGKTYFYIASLFDPISSTADPRSHIAMDACVAKGTGSSATLTCNQPINIASSSECAIQDGFTFCSFLDKDFLSIDRAHGLLYATFTEFGFTPDLSASTDIIELAVCDIGNGALGGTPAAPVCTNGGTGSVLSPAAPYLVVANTDPAGCENEGAYPAVDPANGDVYVAYEHNWASALFGCFPGPQSPVQNVMNFIPASCITFPAASCGGPAGTNAVNIVSLQGAFIPGYNRFPMNDFPRIAVSDAKSTVSMVWNDARFHVGGDILMQSMNLVSLGNTSGAPVVLNTDRGGWHFLPAVRNTNQFGKLNVSWYSRSSANTAITDVTAALDVNARSTATPANVLVTTVSSDWNAVSSDIIPNFGDYTDNYTINTATNTPGSRDFVAWSDGRLGDPQPFSSVAFT